MIILQIRLNIIRRISLYLYNNIRFIAMITMPTWDLFRYKYPTETQQRERFEDLSRALFCIRYNIRYGIFQHANNTGNETSTIVKGSDTIGFQAKYFRSVIDGNNIIASINKAHKSNPLQTKIIIYTNLTFGNPPRCKSKTAVQEQVERAASAIGLEVEWSMDKMILDQVARTQWVYDVFFGTGPNLSTLVDEEQKNTCSILENISSEITISKGRIKVDRSSIIDDILSKIGEHKHFIVYGEGGIGKTAIIKEINSRINKQAPLCIRKAQTLNVDSICELFKHANSYTTEQFKEAYINDEHKVFVIDSAEKLQEIDDDGPTRNLITFLDSSGWSIIFTVRTVFFNDLKENLDFVYKIQAHEYPVDNISEDHLARIAQENNIQLPTNPFFRQRLTNLFYLSLYTQMKDGIPSTMTYSSFMNRAWKEKISGKSTERGLSIKRERCFMEIVSKRISKSIFYVRENDLDAEALQKLIDDEIVTRNSHGIFITHDIYEEWGLEHFITEKWQDKTTIQEFFVKLGSSYLIRRAFRIWLTGRLDGDSSNVKELINSSIAGEIIPLWNDEIIVSVLLSEYAASFFEESTEVLLDNNAKLLNRIVFLLQLACKQHYKSVNIKGKDYIFYAPDGPGWSTVINFIYHNFDRCSNVKYLFQVLEDWTSFNKTGLSTRNSGLIALTMLSGVESDKDVYIPESMSDRITHIICNSAMELKNEISILIDKIVDNAWKNYRDPYYSFSQYILTKPSLSEKLIAAVPEKVIRLADNFWRYTPSTGSSSWHNDELYNPGIRYGISENDYRHGHTVAGAMQTPMYWLLVFSPVNATRFIVDFVNYSISCLSAHAQEYDGLEKLIVYNQAGVGRSIVSSMQLWQLYRGAVHTVVPEILQSLHMALEKFLLQLMEEGEHSEVLTIMTYILDHTNSISLVAIVSSIVCAYPYAFTDIALTLFRTAELFNYDNLRKSDEQILGSTLGLYTFGNEYVAEERSKELHKPFREMCLENLCINYQYIRNETFTDARHQQLINNLNSVFDKLFEEAKQLPKGIKETRLILLYRMDRRKHDPIVTRKDDNSFQIELNPQLPEDVRRHSEEQISMIQSPMRFISLSNWSMSYLSEDVNQRTITKYDEDPSLVVAEMRELYSALQNGEFLMPTSGQALFNSAGLLMHYYAGKLSINDRDYCHDIIWQLIKKSYQDCNIPQIHDGLESCIHALPSIIKYYPNEITEAIEALFRTALNNNSIGAYKRISDYVFETITESHLFEEAPESMAEFVRRYVTCILELDNVKQRECQKNKNIAETLGANNISLTAIVDILMCIKIPLSLDEVLKRDFSSIHISYLENILKLLGGNTNDNGYKLLVQKLSPIVAETLVERDRRMRDFDRVIQLYKSFADYVLNQPLDEIRDLIAPCVDALKDNDNSEYFLTEFIHCEICRPRTNAFWKVWELLYPAILRECKQHDRCLVKVYLLSYPFFHECTEWQSLRDNDTWIYSKIAHDCSNNIQVLHSIAKTLNNIAKKYVHDGINWIYSIVKENPDLDLNDLEQDTIIYLERILGPYSRSNRMQIKSNKSLKEQVLTILTFMVERNSTQAYMLRELVA